MKIGLFKMPGALRDILKSHSTTNPRSPANLFNYFAQRVSKWSKQKKLKTTLKIVWNYIKYKLFLIEKKIFIPLSYRVNPFKLFWKLVKKMSTFSWMCLNNKYFILKTMSDQIIICMDSGLRKFVIEQIILLWSCRRIDLYLRSFSATIVRH